MRIFLDTANVDEIREAVKLGIPTGEWVHLATVYNTAAGTCQSYLNGELMMTRQVGGDIKMEIGDAKIAATHEPFRDLNWQGLRGRMDELAIWSRALSEKELQTLVRETRP